ncbi:MAG: hypothetical protein INR65_06345 [Gluconacetobacter diazotrophicus]|nr:hypothetical protein [Gluconacetobacter diazotrophicus]
MPMTAVFSLFGLGAGAAGLLWPHAVHRLGYKMMAIYLVLAAGTALLGLVRRTR